MDELKKCSNAVQKTAVDQSAYLRASSTAKNYDLAKYKEDVMRELNTPEKEDTSKYALFVRNGDMFDNFYFELIV